MAIEPKEAQTGSDHRRAKHAQFARPRDVRNLQISRRARVAGQIGQNDKNDCDNQRATDRQTVEPIR